MDSFQDRGFTLYMEATLRGIDKCPKKSKLRAALSCYMRCLAHHMESADRNSEAMLKLLINIFMILRKLGSHDEVMSTLMACASMLASSSTCPGQDRLRLKALVVHTIADHISQHRILINEVHPVFVISIRTILDDIKYSEWFNMMGTCFQATHWYYSGMFEWSMGNHAVASEIFKVCKEMCNVAIEEVLGLNTYQAECQRRIYTNAGMVCNKLILRNAKKLLKL